MSKRFATLTTLKLIFFFVDDDGRTPLHRAAAASTDPIPSSPRPLFMDRPANRDARADNTLFAPSVAIVDALLKHMMNQNIDDMIADKFKDYEAPTSFIWKSLVHRMITENKHDIIAGAINIKDDEGSTPLALAIKLGFHGKDVVSKLLDPFEVGVGADPNVADNNGDTPLHHLCRRACDCDAAPSNVDGRGEIAQYFVNTATALLAKGADLKAINDDFIPRGEEAKFGQTPLDILLSHGDKCKEFSEPLKGLARESPQRKHIGWCVTIIIYYIKTFIN